VTVIVLSRQPSPDDPPPPTDAQTVGDLARNFTDGRWKTREDLDDVAEGKHDAAEGEGRMRAVAQAAPIRRLIDPVGVGGDLPVDDADRAGVAP
jgi:hypothetical protein